MSALLTRGRVALAAVAVAAPLSVAVVASGSADAASGGKTVILKHIMFNSAKTTISKGQTITWKWEDPYVTHNLHSRGKPSFKGSSSRMTGDYKVKFTKAGVYKYECTLHPGMYGTIVVK